MQQTLTTIQGDRVLLRPFCEGDAAEAARVWTPELTHMYGGTRRSRGPASVEGRQREFDRIVDSGEHHFAIEADGRYIGFVGLRVAGEEDGNARYRIGIANPDYWGRGYGTEVASLVLRYAFETLGRHRVHLRVAAYNTRAIRCYEKSGFRHEGVERRRFCVDGEWQDDVLMAILREEWEELQRPTTEVVGPKPASCPVTIRAYRDSDYEQIKAIWQETWDNKPMDSRAAIAYKLANDRAPFLVAEADGQIVGTAITSWDGRWAWVGRMAVHRDYRRRGIAKLLLAESERALAALGADFVSLLMNRENAAALGLYEGLGYTLWEHVGYMSKKIEPLGGSPQLSGP